MEAEKKEDEIEGPASVIISSPETRGFILVALAHVNVINWCNIGPCYTIPDYIGAL